MGDALPQRRAPHPAHLGPAQLRRRERAENEEHAQAALDHPGRIWFTETGGLVVRRVYRGRRVVRTYRYSLRHAAKSTAHVLALSCLSSRIARVYLYHWQPPPKVTNWDSGLVDRRGRPRPAYRALRRWLSHSASAARRGGRRALCG